MLLAACPGRSRALTRDALEGGSYYCPPNSALDFLFHIMAEIADQYLRKGGQVYVEGRLHSRQYQDRDGIARTAVEVVASDLVLLGGRGDEASQGAPARQSAPPTAGGIDPHDPPF